MMTDANIKNNVMWLDDASHTVKLLLGFDEEGRINGNRLKPAVEMTPICAKALVIKAIPGRFKANNKMLRLAPVYPSIGAIHVHGYLL